MRLKEEVGGTKILNFLLLTSYSHYQIKPRFNTHHSMQMYFYGPSTARW